MNYIFSTQHSHKLYTYKCAARIVQQRIANARCQSMKIWAVDGVLCLYDCFIYIAPIIFFIYWFAFKRRNTLSVCNSYNNNDNNIWDGWWEWWGCPCRHLGYYIRTATESEIELYYYYLLFFVKKFNIGVCVCVWLHHVNTYMYTDVLVVPI